MPDKSLVKEMEDLRRQVVMLRKEFLWVWDEVWPLVLRSEVRLMNLPKATSILNLAGVLFSGEEPSVGQLPEVTVV
jgi:hypothetical protein